MLSLFQKIQIKIETGWSSAIVDYIRDMDEANVYIKAGLKEGRVNGKAALLNPAIVGEAFNCRNWYGRKHPEYWDWCNADLMGEGYPPHDENGDPYELHHIRERHWMARFKDFKDCYSRMK